MHRRLASHTFILGIACLLSACGFQLRGTGDSSTVVPDAWKSMHLITGQSPTANSAGACRPCLPPTACSGWIREDANYTLTLGPERFSQRNLSLNAEARVAEFELTLRARFSVKDADNNEVMPTADASVVRQMENDPRNVVGKAEEVRILRSEMRTELAQQIMRRIGFFAASTQ